MTEAPKQAWGGGAKETCPHCGEVKARNHQRICEKNPARDLALIERLRAGGRKRAAQDRAPEPAPVAPIATEPPAPAPPVRASPVPLKPVTTSSADADRFMRARIEELRSTRAPPAVTPSAGQVTSRSRTTWSFTPSPLLVRLMIGTAAVASLGYLFTAWRRRKGKSKAQMPPEAMPREPYRGPRAWTPDPGIMPVARDEVVPGGQWGGGYIPSPETQWDRSNAETVRRQH